MAINLIKVSKGFTNNGTSLSVLDRISLSVADGEAVAILGPSGCGKTTLLRLIAALEDADAGELTIASDTGNKQALEMVFQQPALLPWRTALENVLLPIELCRDSSPEATQGEAQTNAIELLKRTGLETFASYHPHQLSGGMKSRVAIARALITRPSILLLDEPFSALDEVTRSALQDLLAEIASELCLTTIFVTHSVYEAVVMADRVVVLSNRPATIVADMPVGLPHDTRLRRRHEEALKMCTDLRAVLAANAGTLEAQT